MSQRNLSGHQSKIVKRYYDNLDTIVATRLQELVTELYLADSEKKQARLWARAKQQLDKTAVDPARVNGLIESGDVAEFANLVNKLIKGDKGILKQN